MAYSAVNFPHQSTPEGCAGPPYGKRASTVRIFLRSRSFELDEDKVVFFCCSMPAKID